MNDRYGWEDRDERNRHRREFGESSRERRDHDDYQRSYGRGAGPRDLHSEDDEWRSRGNQASGSRYQTDADRNQRRYSSSPGSTYGYGEGRPGGYGARAGGFGYSSQGRDGPRQSYAQQSEQGHRHYTSSEYGYGSGQQGDTTPPQPYFTGQQQSWEVPPVRGAPGSSYGASYGGGTFGSGYGEDYREHGYTAGGQHRGFLEKAGDEIASWFGDDDAARRREQDHRGRGPQDYTRSDERIREDANDRLTDDPRVDASAISVTVENGEITLNGTVSGRDQKRRAEDVVDHISGVKHVQNNLRVRNESGGSTGASSGFGTGGTGVFGDSTGSAGATASTASSTGTSAKSSDTSST
jgi:osmotically-inducible protein OsmY